MSRIDHSEASSKFIEAKDHLEFHDRRLWDLRKKRDRESVNLPEWEELRALASAIKEHTLSHLADYLEEFERNAKRNGAEVHWAKDAAEHNQIVLDIMRANERKHAGQGQVDADRRMRDAAFSREPRHRSDGNRPRRTHPAARRRAAEPHRRSRRAQASRRRCAGVLTDHRHRPGQQRRALPCREPATAHAALLPARRTRA